MLDSYVYIYKPWEVNVNKLTQKSQQLFQVQPFSWQLEAASSILQGKDVVVDVGTGSGKTICFSLPLLTNDTDIALIISPLLALMIDQAGKSPPEFPSVAVCSETLEKGADKLFAVSA